MQTVYKKHMLKILKFKIPTWQKGHSKSKIEETNKNNTVVQNAGKEKSYMANLAY